MKQVTLIDFLIVTKLLVAKHRKDLLFDLQPENPNAVAGERGSNPDALNTAGGGTGGGVVDADGKYHILQIEVEKGLKKLIDAIQPYLMDIKEAEALQY